MLRQPPDAAEHTRSRAPSLFSFRREGSSRCPINVGDTERRLSTLAGGALTLFGLARGSLGGMAVAALGGAMLYRGLSGHCVGYQALGITQKSAGSTYGVCRGQAV